MVAPVNDASNGERRSCHVTETSNVLATTARRRITATNLEEEKRRNERNGEKPEHYNSLVRKPVVLITGAGGEIGHGLIDRLADRGDRGIVTLDLNRLDPSISAKVDREITARFSIADCWNGSWRNSASSSCFILPPCFRHDRNSRR
jgi:FlaA1/EpsC-like NDP-sugar epimerase